VKNSTVGRLTDLKLIIRERRIWVFQLLKLEELECPPRHLCSKAYKLIWDRGNFEPLGGDVVTPTFFRGLARVGGRCDF